MVKWDEEKPATIDPKMVKWDEADKKPAGEPISRAEKFGKGLRDPIDGGAQLLTKILPEGVVRAGNRFNNWLSEKTGLVAPLPEGGVDQQVRESEAAYQAKREAAGETGFDGYRVLGNVFNPANIAIASRAPLAASLAGRMGVGAAAGGASGLLNPVTSGDFAEEKGKQVALGGLFGGLLPAITGTVGRIISPAASKNADLAALKAAGVKPTVGQALGGRASALEEKAQSLPILGDAIANARTRALEQFNNAAINRATGQVGAKVEGAGQSAVREAGDIISQTYDDALASVKFVKFDKQFGTDLTQLKSMAKSMTPEMRRKFESTLKDVVGGRSSKAGAMLPETFKKVDSELGQLASRYGKSTMASEQELGDALRQLQTLLRDQAARQSPEFAKALKASDAGWANLVRIEGASKAAKNAEGIFTPAQLNTAIQAADDSVRKRAVSRGTALMQDLGNAGQKVLGNKVPNSFTTDRALIAGGGLGAYFIDPTIPAALLGGAAMYSAPLQRALLASVSSRPELAQPVAEALKKASPALIPAAAQVGLGFVE